MDLVEKVKKAKIYFGLPTYDGKVDIHYFMNMLATQRLLDKYGIQSFIHPVLRDVYIARARNDIAADFLKSDYTHLFFIDADMGWQPEKVLKLIARDKEVVFGGYSTKDEKNMYLFQPYRPDGNLVTEDGLVKCLSGPTGFMCIKRQALEKMRDKYPNMAYEDDNQQKWNFFHCYVRNIIGKQQWFGEDVSFCHNWVSMGGDLWCEPDITFQHIGTKTWECNYNTDLTRHKEVQDAHQIAHTG